MKTIEAYLEGFHEISVLYPNTEENQHLDDFYLAGESETIVLNLASKKTLGDTIKYIFDFKGFIFLNKTYYVYDSLDRKIELYSGEVVRSELFDNLFYYDGDDLGVSYTPTATTFKMWSPVAKEVNVILFKADQETTHPLSYVNQGVWSVEVEGDLEGVHYLFEAHVNGKTKRFNDLYALASTANGKRNIVINPKKIHQPKHKRPFKHTHPTEAIIYEASVRDMTSSDTVNAEEKSTFNDFKQSGLKTLKGLSAGFDYIKDLGVTHVQLLPIYDFEGVDETDRFKHYNWGYNPSQYFVPEGSFTTKPNDPYARINELIDMIDAYHEQGIGIIMDVVYNHIYNIKTFPFDMMIPGYAYRVDHNGVLTNASGCDSDLATERLMVRKLIVDSVFNWINMYNIDGFRFDLMGLIDCHTMHIIRQKLEFIDPSILLYGEGWNMPTVVPSNTLCHMDNKKTLYNIGFFNDQVRETIKGETFQLKQKGFATGQPATQKTLNLIQAKNTAKAITYPSQSINYVECHDNHTFYDKARVAMKSLPEKNVLQAQKLATSMMVLMQGVPFIHAGQEFYRSKQGEGNSYKSPDNINAIDWTLRDKHHEDIEDFKKLIKIRKTEPLLKLTTPYDIEHKTFVRSCKSGTIVYELNDEKSHIIIIFKNNEKHETFTFDGAFDIIYHSEAHQIKTLKPLSLSTISTTILKQTKRW